MNKIDLLPHNIKLENKSKEDHLQLRQNWRIKLKSKKCKNSKKILNFKINNSLKNCYNNLILNKK